MSLKKYEAFSKTVELGSLTNAADALGYTQSGISHMLNSLEDELGFTLLRRSRCGIRLTAEGELVLPKIRQILEHEKELSMMATRIARNMGGVIRVGAFTSVAVHWLPEIIKSFQADHPSLEIRLSHGDYHEVETMLDNGDIDVAFLTTPTAPGVNYTELKKDPLVVALPVNHPLTRYNRIPISLVVREPMIVLPESMSRDTYVAINTADCTPNIRYVGKDAFALIAMVQAGMGISILPSLLLKNAPEQIAVRDLAVPVSRTIVLATRENGNSHVDAFCQCAEKWVSENG